MPDKCLTVPPPSALHTTHDGSVWLIDMAARSSHIRAERDGKLTAIYAPAIEQLNRWIDSSEDNPAALAHYKTQRSAWHAWADALCDLPDQPGFPWPDGDVPWPEQPPKPTRYTP
ncbi:MAG: phage tail assembly chaperone [Desulfobacterales bacterium]|nr:phage tail assembly chaperone [Desulfobacterales bacterium]